MQLIQFQIVRSIKIFWRIPYCAPSSSHVNQAKQSREHDGWIFAESGEMQFGGSGDNPLPIKPQVLPIEFIDFPPAGIVPTLGFERGIDPALCDEIVSAAQTLRKQRRKFMPDKGFGHVQDGFSDSLERLGMGIAMTAHRSIRRADRATQFANEGGIVGRVTAEYPIFARFEQKSEIENGANPAEKTSAGIECSPARRQRLSGAQRSHQSI